jgi:excinuclease ABC subunit A
MTNFSPSFPKYHIQIQGARTHNLKNITVTIPRHQLVVITGPSGSGKSSLAFDTLYAEGQRRYVESLNTYARQFLQLMAKPDVDSIEGLSPAISIEQKSTLHNPRSTVGTITEVHDYLRLLFARAGTPFCPDHHLPLEAQSVSQMVDALLLDPTERKLMILAPVVRARKGEFQDLMSGLLAQGFVRFRIDGAVVEAHALPALDKHEAHDIDVVVDRMKLHPTLRQRLVESLETALRLAEGRVITLEMDNGKEQVFSNRFACPVCNYALSELEPRLFSFNSPIGACPRCEGLGEINDWDPSLIVSQPDLSLASGAIRGWSKEHPTEFEMLKSWATAAELDLDTPYYMLSCDVQHQLLWGPSLPTSKTAKKKSQPVFRGVIPTWAERLAAAGSTSAVREELLRYQSPHSCPECMGSRLKREARHVHLQNAKSAMSESPGTSLHEIQQLNLRRCLEYFEQLQLKGFRAQIAQKVIYEIQARLQFLVDVGLGYLTLARGANTLSGGEAQRIRLASQIGSGLTGVLYVLDEPSIGLHQRDNDRLIDTLRRLRDLGNSVIVVEHDEDAIRAADHVIDMGPGAGAHGGHLVAQGTPQYIEQHPESLTGAYLSGRLIIPLRRSSQAATAWLRIKGATGNNLQGITAEIPVGQLTCVIGVSGSGKSTLINNTLYPAAARRLNRSNQVAAPHDSIEGLEHFDKVINVDQSPIGRTPRSNPATYTGLFTSVRELFAAMPVARERGYGAGRFSFNVPGGRCETCQGDGVMKVEMHFLPDLYVPCDVCHSRRYNRETLEVKYKNKNIAEVLDLTVEEGLTFFKAIPNIDRKLKTLIDVGLSYIQLGQSAITLSGGESQRVKLAVELSKRDTGRTLYILDEPTTGLHFADIALLLQVLHRLKEAGNTIVVIEHNLEVIKTADWLIELGPEGGELGGQIVATGPPEKIASHPNCATGPYLAKVLQKHQ